MADTKLSALSALAGSSIDPAADLLLIDDVSATTSKKILVQDLVTATAATQAQQETGTSVLTSVTPGRQQYHQSALKGWAYADSMGGIVASYGLSSVTDNGAGDITFTWAGFSSANYSPVASIKSDANLICTIANSSFSSTVTRLFCRDTDGVFSDPNQWSIHVAGDL